MYNNIWCNSTGQCITAFDRGPCKQNCGNSGNDAFKNYQKTKKNCIVFPSYRCVVKIKSCALLINVEFKHLK